jgi:hypothetical protein
MVERDSRAKGFSMTTVVLNGRVSRHVSNDEMHTEKMFVTPDMAFEWLSQNLNNRHLREGDVQYLKQCILNGSFRLTHQGIAFYVNGVLADGQHRLTAIVEAGVGVWLNVTRSVPLDNADAIDRGRTRTHRDHLKFSGFDVDTRRVAICVCLINQYYVQTSENAERWSKKRLQPGQFAKFYESFAEAIDFSYSTNKQLHSCAVAAIAAAWFTQDRDRIAHFRSILATGGVADPSEHAAIRLRDYLMKKQYGQGEAARNDLFLKSCSALRAFLEGRGLTKLYVTNDNVFPLPLVR